MGEAGTLSSLPRRGEIEASRRCGDDYEARAAIDLASDCHLLHPLVSSSRCSSKLAHTLKFSTSPPLIHGRRTSRRAPPRRPSFQSRPTRLPSSAVAIRVLSISFSTDSLPPPLQWRGDKARV